MRTLIFQGQRFTEEQFDQRIVLPALRRVCRRDNDDTHATALARWLYVRPTRRAIANIELALRRLVDAKHVIVSDTSYFGTHYYFPKRWRNGERARLGWLQTRYGANRSAKAFGRKLRRNSEAR